MLPTVALNVCAFIANLPSKDNEYLKNYKITELLELDNYTIKNYVVGIRANVSYFWKNFGILYLKIFGRNLIPFERSRKAMTNKKKFVGTRSGTEIQYLEVAKRVGRSKLFSDKF
jgi:hypothetical protein